MSKGAGWATEAIDEIKRRASPGGAPDVGSFTDKAKHKRLAENLTMINSRNKLEKFAACRELSAEDYRGEYSAWGALMAKLEDTDKDIRRQACIGLGIISKRQDENTLRALVRAGTDRDWSVREAAVKSAVLLDGGLKHGVKAEGRDNRRHSMAAGFELKSPTNKGHQDDDVSEGWWPACAMVRETVARAMNDVQSEVRCTATQLIGECVARGDAFALTCILQAGGEVLSIWSLDEDSWERLTMDIPVSRATSAAGAAPSKPNIYTYDLSSYSSTVASGGIPLASSSRSIRRPPSSGFHTAASNNQDNSGGNSEGFGAMFTSASTMSLGMSMIKSWGGLASIGTHDWNPQIKPPGSVSAAKRLASTAPFKSFPSMASSFPSLSTASSGATDSIAPVVRGKAFYGLLGAHAPLSGRVVWCRAVHPPMLVTEDVCGEQGSSDWVAVFRLESTTSQLHYDCCLRAVARGASATLFVCRDPGSNAVGIIKHSESFTGPDQVHPPTFEVPIMFVGEDCLTSLEDDRACVYLEPSPSMRQARFADSNAKVRVAAAKSVVKIAAQDDLRVIKGLLELMADQDRDVRMACGEAFKNMRVVSKCNPIATMGLAELSMHEETDVRESAMLALINVAKNDGGGGVDHAMVDVAISALRERLHDVEGMLRKLAVEALVALALADGEIDSDDIAIIDTFIDAMFEVAGDPVVTTQCAKSLVIMSKEPQEVASGFNWLVDGRAVTRRNAVKSIGGGRRGNLIILTVLKRMLHDPEGAVREQVVRSLINIAEIGDYEYLEMIMEMTGDGDGSVRRAVCDAAVALMDPADLPFCSTICEALFSLLKDPNVEVREGCIEALGKITAVSQDLMDQALKGVWNSMDSDDKTLRRAALLALPKIIPIGHPGLVEGVVRGMKDPYTETQKLAIGMVRSHIPDALDHEPPYQALRGALLEVTESDDEEGQLVRAMGLESMPLVFQRGERDAVMSLVRSLRSHHQTVQETAARVLGDLSEVGDERVVSLMLPLLESKLAYVRRSSVTSLGKIASRGDARVLRGIMTLLEDREPYVRRECAETLPKISTKGLSTTVEALALLCNDMDEKIRGLAISGLGSVASKGDKVAIGALIERLRMEGRSMRREAIDALGGLIDGRDREGMSMVIMCIEDSDDVVRKSGIDTIIANAERGDEGILNGLLSNQFLNPNRKIREAASQILVGLAVPGHPATIDALVELMSHESGPVRKEACHLLSQLALVADDKAIVALGKMISDTDGDVKAEAVRGMGVVAGCKNDRLVVLTLAEKLQNKDWSVRECAAGAMLMHTERGNDLALATVSGLLLHQDVYVRLTAVETIKKLALPCVCKLASGDTCMCAIVPALIETTRDEAPNIRKAAVEALELIANRKDKRVADRVKREMLSDKDYSVRGAVEHAIGVFFG